MAPSTPARSPPVAMTGTGSAVALGLMGGRTARGAIQSGYRRADGKRTSVRELGAGDGPGSAADQPLDCFPNWLFHRPVGAASCEALIFSSSPSTRRSCACEPWWRVKDAERRLVRSPLSLRWPSWCSPGWRDGSGCGCRWRPFPPLSSCSVSIWSSAQYSVCWLRAHRPGMPSGKRCGCASKLWMPHGDPSSSPQLYRLQPRCSASTAAAAAGDRGSHFSDDRPGELGKA